MCSKERCQSSARMWILIACGPRTALRPGFLSKRPSPLASQTHRKGMEPWLCCTGFQGWERLMWNISLADGARNRFFYLSLHTCLLWQHWETSLLLRITNFQREYRVPGLPRQDSGEPYSSPAAPCHHCQPWWSCANSQQEGCEAVLTSCHGACPKSPLHNIHKLVFSGKWLLFVVNSS